MSNTSLPSSKLSLSAHIAAIRAASGKESAATVASKREALLYWGDYADKEYLLQLKSCVGPYTTYVRAEAISMISELTLYCKKKEVTKVVSSSISLLKILLHWNKKAAPSLSDYAGSYFKIDSFDKSHKIEVIFIAPLKQLVTVPYGKFMARRIITKLTTPAAWYQPTEYKGYTLITPSNEPELFAQMMDASVISIDIETLRENATIRCLSYTGVFLPANTSLTVVLAMDSEYALAIMRKWNSQLQAPKIGQNFKYDLAYFARFSAPVYNYLYDTANLFHCWYSELPKDLGFLNSFFLREATYWKDLAETNDLYEYYNYNGLDTWGTANCFLAMLHEAPAYAINNYLLEFPLVFPCHLSEMTGIERDMSRLADGRAEQEKIVSKAMDKLNTILAIPKGQSFNVKSPPQMKALLKILGCGDLKSTDAKSLAKVRFRHPFNARIVGLILEVRKARDLISKYLTEGKEFSRQDGTGYRILYSLNPHGTDTSRLASREHHFWTGLQVQNIPRGKAVKQTLRADPGFHLVEVDLEQAESRDTGYISGDETLIYNVEFSPDFHCSNASAFFGIPFEQLYDVEAGKVLNKPIRQLGKPVNHGANYNMGAYVLIDTMGEENIVLAKQLLKLPRFWTYVQVAEHLLEGFHKTYKGIRDVFYAGVVAEILKTSLLRSMAVHHGWTSTLNIEDLRQVAPSQYPEQCGKAWVRHCFSDPSKSKSALNAYIAHPPQSLNAQTLNKAYMSVFTDIAMNPQHATNFKLCAQIHDSILFQCRDGHEYLHQKVADRMQVPVTIRGYDGKIRTFVVPAGIKNGKHLDKKRADYWSETE